MKTAQQCMNSRKAAIIGAKRTMNHPSANGSSLAKVSLFFYFENEHELAIQALNKAISLQPKVGQHHSDPADSLWALKRKDEAERHYRTALSLDSTSLQRLIWSVRTGVDPSTAPHFVDKLKWDPHAENFAWLGSTFTDGEVAHEGMIKALDAITAYETALELEPKHPESSAWRERLAYIEGLLKKAKVVREMERVESTWRSHQDALARPTELSSVWLWNYGNCQPISDDVLAAGNCELISSVMELLR